MFRPLRTLLLFLMPALLPSSARAQSYYDLFSQASALSARGDYTGAIDKFHSALRLRPGAPEALSNLGVMYHMAARYAEAEILQRDPPWRLLARGLNSMRDKVIPR